MYSVHMDLWTLCNLNKIYAYKTRYSSYAIQTRNYASFQKKIANTYI